MVEEGVRAARHRPSSRALDTVHWGADVLPCPSVVVLAVWYEQGSHAWVLA
jgi:hypothetical protein